MWWQFPKIYNWTDNDDTRCPVSHCSITYDKALISRCHAVLFHARDLDYKELNHYRDMREKYPWQVWVLVHFESPANTHLGKILVFEDLFNWTLTYDHRSDIAVPYGRNILLKANERRPAAGTNFAAGKDKVVFTAISNCDSTARIAFVSELQKHVAVDVYGKCQKKINPRANNTCNVNTNECTQLKARYKFVIAIENSLCEDYVTEKFYVNGLHDGLVPIALNGGNLEDVKIAPPDSFIDINKFQRVSELGRYLNFLNENDKDYNRFHQWRSHYEIGGRKVGCLICEALWRNDDERLMMNQKIDLKSIWSKNKCRNMSRVLLSKII